MNAIKRRVIVSIDKQYDDEIKLGDSTLYVDPAFTPTEKARIYGDVVAVSENVSFANELAVGHRVYFHYNVVEDSHIDEDLYNVEEERIFCKIENGEPVPLGDWVLLEPYKEHNDTVNVDGKKVKVIVKGDLVVGLGEKTSAELAKVSYIGSNDLNLEQGDIVVMLPNFEFKNEIEGKEYFTSKKQYIIGKYEPR
jgi:hypothetical protein